MKYRTITVIFSLLLSVLPASSQVSILGLEYPLGMPKVSGTGSSLSLGGCATGINNDFFGFNKNPAILGVMNRAVFSGLLSLKFMSLNDDNSNSQHALFEPSSFQFSFPAANFGSIGVGFNQLSKTNLLFRKDSAYFDPLKNKSVRLTLGKVIDGGATEWQIGYGITPLKNFRAGISYERLYFKNNKVSYIKDAETHADTLVDSTSIKLSSNAFSIGMMYTIKNTLTLGISGKYYAKGTARLKDYLWGVDRYIDTTISKNTDNTYDTSIVPKERTITTTSSSKVSLPPLLSLGVSYKLSPEWLVAADVDITFWDRYRSDIQMQYEDENGLSNAANFCIGTQFIPAPNLLTPKYYEIIQYRGGFRFTRLPGSQAYETALTLGTGLPLKQGGGIFDLFIEVGRRWDKRFSGLSENFFGINIGLNGGQKWFQTTEEGY